MAKNKDLVTIFAENVRTKRVEKQLTQEELGEKAGISTSYVSMLERGQRSPPLETVEGVAKALGVKPVSLLEAA